MRIAVARFNAVVRDPDGNIEPRTVVSPSDAGRVGAQVLLTRNWRSTSPPEDLLLRPDFYRACRQALNDLAGSVEGLALIVGFPEEHEGRRYNAAAVIENGRVSAVYRKTRLPNYDVFDEKRYFDAGSEACVVTLGGVRCGINICADVWEAGTAERAADAGAELLLVLNASACHLEKHQQRVEVMRERIAATGIPAIYADLVGGQDELVFDGQSLAVASRRPKVSLPDAAAGNSRKRRWALID